MDRHQSPSKQELEARLKELENEYSYALSLAGLAKGIVTTFAAMLSGLCLAVLGLIAFLRAGPGFLSGTQLAIIYGIIAAVVIVYFSFVFSRAARIRAEISETKKLLDISSGDSVR